MTNCKNKIVLWLITVICPLIIGAVFYYICCPSVWFVQKLDYIVGIADRQAYIPQSIWEIGFRYYFFDFIWAFSLSNAINIIYSNNTKTIMTAVIITVFLGSLMEVMQLCKIAQGTFDIYDIFVELAGSLFGVFIIKNLRRAIKNEKN